jgi:hypothetical protein
VTEAMQDGRIYIETINGRFLFKEGGTPDEYSAGLGCAVAKGMSPEHTSNSRLSVPRSLRES